MKKFIILNFLLLPVVVTAQNLYFCAMSATMEPVNLTFRLNTESSISITNNQSLDMSFNSQQPSPCANISAGVSDNSANLTLVNYWLSENSMSVNMNTTAQYANGDVEKTTAPTQLALVLKGTLTLNPYDQITYTCNNVILAYTEQGLDGSSWWIYNNAPNLGAHQLSCTPSYNPATTETVQLSPGCENSGGQTYYCPLSSKAMSGTIMFTFPED